MGAPIPEKLAKKETEVGLEENETEKIVSVEYQRKPKSEIIKRYSDWNIEKALEEKEVTDWLTKKKEVIRIGDEFAAITNPPMAFSGLSPDSGGNNVTSDEKAWEKMKNGHGVIQRN